MQNARLYGKPCAGSAESEEIARFAQTLTGSLDENDIAQRIVTSVLPALRALSWASASSSPTARSRSWRRARAPASSPCMATSCRAGYGISGRVLAEGRAIASTDVLGDPHILLTPEMRANVEESKIGSFLAVPLRVRDELIGTLSVADVTGRQFSDVDTALLQTFADQAALALDHTRLYAQTPAAASPRRVHPGGHRAGPRPLEPRGAAEPDRAQGGGALRRRPGPRRPQAGRPESPRHPGRPSARGRRARARGGAGRGGYGARRGHAGRRARQRLRLLARTHSPGPEHGAGGEDPRDHLLSAPHPRRDHRRPLRRLLR